MNDADYIDDFLYTQQLLIHEMREQPFPKAQFETFFYLVGVERSKIIKQLKERGVPGYKRSRANNILSRYIFQSHREYLYAIDPTCGLCGVGFNNISEATIDHIKPLSRGGENALHNKQLAHGICNVEKGNKWTPESLLNLESIV